jgi:predicted enzyme related to lactoylglutathione lyase
MKNKNGTTENMTEYHENGKRAYEFYTNVFGVILEYTFDKKGNHLAYKDSNGLYIVKGTGVTLREYEAFIKSLDNQNK